MYMFTYSLIDYCIRKTSVHSNHLSGADILCNCWQPFQMWKSSGRWTTSKASSSKYRWDGRDRGIRELARLSRTIAPSVPAPLRFAVKRTPKQSTIWSAAYRQMNEIGDKGMRYVTTNIPV
ncbi:hypothetical protein BDR03DRAFT_980698 [Suillus americanus]|nr:hypothetical protein BDR03DRAFT_980698 [Suillus americanus]